MSAITIHPVIPADARAIAELWNPIIRDSAFTFTSAQKTVSGLTQQIMDCNREGRGFFWLKTASGLWGFAPIFNFAVVQDMHALWNIRLFWQSGRGATVLGGN